MNKSKSTTIMAVTASFLLCSILLIASLLSAEPQQPQSPLITIPIGASTQQLDLIYEFVQNHPITPVPSTQLTKATDSTKPK